MHGESFDHRKVLRTNIERWWAKNNWAIPQLFLTGHPIAGFGRPVATFRYEDAVFSEYAAAAKLSPFWLEYTAGKFSTESRPKKSLLRPRFFVRRGRRNGMVIKPVQLAPFQKWRGKPIDRITLTCGKRLVDFHHHLHDSRIPNSREDLSDFYGQFGSAEQYYEAYLSLFIAHGVMFEDYHGGESGSELATLTDKVFTPAFVKLRERFGINPLLVQMPWHDDLRFYPEPASDWRAGSVIQEQLLPS